MITMRVVIATVLSIALIWDGSFAHPQCLDSLPPYRRHNCMCRDYNIAGYSCCKLTTEARICKSVERFGSTRSEDEPSQECKELLFKVLCTECSPWAQHIYEGTPRINGKAFPSLCLDFCVTFYRQCFKLIFDYYGISSAGYDGSVASATRFCEMYQATNDYYCYPKIIDGPSFPPDRATPQPKGNCLCGSVVASGLRNPIAAIPPGDGSGRLFIAEQIGVIKVLTSASVLLARPFLNIRKKVYTSSWPGDERGLLGLAFHPNFATNGRFYVQYSTRINIYHYNKVSEFIVTPQSPTVADPSSEREIFKIRQPQGNHNGGQLFFKDGYLFIVLGDGGGAGDRHGRIGNGLDTSTLHGSILRVDVSNTSVPYSIPPDNPFADGVGGRPEIYAYGLRNPWRCSVDRGDANGVGAGRIFCGDVGQGRFEEIDIIEKGGNYGWRAYEGFACYDRRLCTNVTDPGVLYWFCCIHPTRHDCKCFNFQLYHLVIPPIHAYPHRIGRSVTGGYVYRGSCFPRLYGKYIFADFEQG